MKFSELSYKQRIQARKMLRKENQRYTPFLEQLSKLPDGAPKSVTRAWRSKAFLVQEYRDNGHIRLSINRTDFDLETGHWIDGITWDELQAIKRGCGYASAWAVEVFPSDSQIVNVANMRHLWILPTPPAFGWKATDQSEPE